MIAHHFASRATFNFNGYRPVEIQALVVETVGVKKATLPALPCFYARLGRRRAGIARNLVPVPFRQHRRGRGFVGWFIGRFIKRVSVRIRRRSQETAELLLQNIAAPICDTR